MLCERLGLPALEVLRAATLGGAEIMGIDDKLGSICAGKLADFVVLGSNPIDDIAAVADVRYVIKNGVIQRRPSVLNAESSTIPRV
jgi:imidazolonepropionase-like amidohydrolase